MDIGIELLSAEGQIVYSKLSAELGGSDAGKMDSLLFAYHAEAVADVMRRQGQKEYSALDYFEDCVRVDAHADGSLPAQGLYQKAVASGKELVAYHNIREDELIDALNFGGFPMPSIAIMERGTEFTKYGHVTLVAGRELIEPDKRTPVYSRDAFTATFPTPEYKKPVM